MRELVEDSLAITPAILKRLMVDGREDLDFWKDEEDGEECLFVSLTGHEPQKIRLKEHYSKILDRIYLRCECGRPVYKLYLPPDGSEFKCRRCHRLRYELETFNKASIHGRIRYRNLRADKLSRLRMAIGTPIYNGRYTKRFHRFLRMASRVELTKVVRDAVELMEHLRKTQARTF